MSRLRAEEISLDRALFLGELGGQLPSIDESVDWIHKLDKPSVCDVLEKAEQPVLQPRSGVADHGKMCDYIRQFDESSAGILTLTIDSYTRLNQYERLARAMAVSPSEINGYPLTYHGWQKGRELNQLAAKPIQIRHGSPDPRLLFEFSVASGFTSFEGGGITYNLPYCKDVPLEASLRAWRYVDQQCGKLAAAGVIVDRELFGTLTAVLSPPALSIAICILEAYLAQLGGVECISIALTQCGSFNQDIAALLALREAMRTYLAIPHQFVVLHQYMGPFPQHTVKAYSLLLKGSLIGKFGQADKIVTKTTKEAICLPDLSTNIVGLDVSAICKLLDLSLAEYDPRVVEEEGQSIRAEVNAILACFTFDESIPAQVIGAFADGILDYPFCTNISVKSQIVCLRDAAGAIRVVNPGNVPIPKPILKNNILKTNYKTFSDQDLFKKEVDAIYHFL